MRLCKHNRPVKTPFTSSLDQSTTSSRTLYPELMSPNSYPEGILKSTTLQEVSAYSSLPAMGTSETASRTTLLIAEQRDDNKRDIGRVVEQ